jgi:hypothetical protein
MIRSISNLAEGSIGETSFVLELGLALPNKPRLKMSFDETETMPDTVGCALNCNAVLPRNCFVPWHPWARDCGYIHFFPIRLKIAWRNACLVLVTTGNLCSGEISLVSQI